MCQNNRTSSGSRRRSHGTILLLLVFFPLASLGQANGPQRLQLPGFAQFDRELRDALSGRDIAALSLLVKFPLRLNHSDGSVTALLNPQALRTRFDEAFPPPVRTAVLASRPEDMLENTAGIAYRGGVLWVALLGSGDSRRYRVSSVNIPTQGSEADPIAESRLEMVCESADHRVVVDTTAEGHSRFRAWNKPRPLRSKPDLELLPGKVRLEGSSPCVHAIWAFTNHTTQYALHELGCHDGSPPDGAIGNLVVTSDAPEQTWWCF